MEGRYAIPSTLTEAQHRLLHDGVIQTAFPVAPTLPPAAPTPRYVLWLIEYAQDLFWPLVGLLAGIVCVLLLRFARSVRWPARAKQPAPVPAPIIAAAVDGALSDPQALAASGSYDAAVHALLLQAVATLAQRHPRAIAPAQTGRDITGLASLTPPERDAVTGLVTLVERARFALRALDATDWAAARRHAAPLLPAPLLT